MGPAPGFRAPSVLLERALRTSVRQCGTRRWAWVLFPRNRSSLVQVSFVILRVLPDIELPEGSTAIFL